MIGGFFENNLRPNHYTFPASLLSQLFFDWLPQVQTSQTLLKGELLYTLVLSVPTGCYPGSCCTPGGTCSSARQRRRCPPGLWSWWGRSPCLCPPSHCWSSRSQIWRVDWGMCSFCVSCSFTLNEEGTCCRSYFQNYFQPTANWILEIKIYLIDLIKLY